MSNKSLIHFSGDDYWISNPHSRYHIVKAFWKLGYKILWINPIGVRFPSLKKKGTSSRILRKVKSLAKLLRKADDNFYVFTPFIIPSFKKGKIQNINNLLIKFQIRVLQLLLKLKEPILFYTSPLYASTLDYLNRTKAIYYYSDKYTHFRELSEDNKKYLIALDEKLYKNVDLILCASMMLYDDLKSKTNVEVQYFPHQVDFDFFNGYKDNFIPEEIKNISKPIIGYYGTLTPSNDWDLIEYLATKRPNYNFVLIGRKEIHLDRIDNLKNVYFLGKKDYKELPQYASHFDVCIMFWTMKEWIKNSSPLKVKEYLALKKPVVSTYISEVEKKFGNVVAIANNKEEYLKYLDKAINEKDDDILTKGVELVKNESWDKVVLKLEKEITNKENK